MNVLVDGLIINYRDIGSKQAKTVLFIHGWGDNGSSFDVISRDLSDNYRCIVLDLPGFGNSQTPVQPLKLEDFSDIISNFLKKIKAKPYAVVAHSNGGAITIDAVYDRKLRPDRIVLLASSGLRGGQTFKKSIYKILAQPAKAGLAVLPKARSQAIKKKLYARIGSDYMVSEHMKATFKNIVSQDISEKAKGLKLPVLLIYGGQDGSTPPRMGKVLNGLIKDSKLKIIEDAGHFIQHDQPQEVIGSIRQFLK